MSTPLHTIEAPPTPRVIYDDPQAYLPFICADTDEACEGQHFDRKDVPRPRDGSVGCAPSDIKKIKEIVQETVSAFCNASGGLLVLGVSKAGELLGVDHLGETQLNDALRLDHLLVGHNCSTRMADVQGPCGCGFRSS